LGQKISTFFNSSKLEKRKKKKEKENTEKRTREE
jgi:hypothetical protein